MFIAWAKFTNLPGQSYAITNPITGTIYPIYGFNVTNNFPFPTEAGTNNPADKPTGWIVFPYIAFNYLGQLTFDGQTLADRDEYIPIAKGSVLVVKNPVTKAFLLPGAPPIPGSPDVAETPPGNSTSSSYNIVHIDRLTGRAVLEYQKLQ